MPRTQYRVYVIELSKKVFSENRRFRDANPQFNGVLQCLYVGMTSKDPKDRFLQHKRGYRNKKGHKLSAEIWVVPKTKPLQSHRSLAFSIGGTINGGETCARVEEKAIRGVVQLEFSYLKKKFSSGSFPSPARWNYFFLEKL
jgi:hypothetical protein